MQTLSPPNAAFAPRLLLTLLALCALTLCGMTGTASAQDANGVCRATLGGQSANSGANWSQPKDLVSALNNYSCAEIWVQKGKYVNAHYPYLFTIRANARVYGGFAGTETSRSQRNPAVNITVLSGDKDQNDYTDPNGIDLSYTSIVGTNSQNVVKMQSQSGVPITSATILDGFTITGGDSRPLAGFGSGAGLTCNGQNAGNECSPTLSNLVFVGNVAPLGGALRLDGGQSGNSSPAISNVIFTHNYATGGSSPAYGGAIFCNANPVGQCNPTLTNVVFSYNDSTYYGGAMWNDAQGGGTSNPILNNVIFDHNTANYNAGAMENYGYGGTSNPSLTDVTFSNNSSNLGGAMVNVAANFNGNTGTSNPTLNNVTFFNNSANAKGGAVYTQAFLGGSSNLQLMNVTFSGNRGGQYGGAIYTSGVASNTPGTADVESTNVILWGNTASYGSNLFFDDSNNANTSLSLNYSVVQNGDASIAYLTGNPSSAYGSGTGNYNGDPSLGPLSMHGGFTPTMVPGPMGDAIDAGTCSGALPVDQRVAPRPSGSGCDIGSVEAQSDTIFDNGFQSN